jgi:YD repeat-containing protein
MSYDVLGRPTRIRYGATTAQPTAFTSRVDNTWDVVGRVTEIADWTCRDPSAFPDCGSPVVAGLTRRTYDNFDRLIREVTLQGEVDYMYDNVGRRTSMTIINGPPNAQIVQPTIT